MASWYLIENNAKRRLQKNKDQENKDATNKIESSLHNTYDFSYCYYFILLL